MTMRGRYIAALLAALAAGPSSTAFAAGDTQALAETIHRQIVTCWSVPPDLPVHVKDVRVSVSLTPAGELDGSPSIEGPVAGDAASRAFSASAIRAVVRCAPYRGLSQFGDYALWKTLSINFRQPDL